MVKRLEMINEGSDLEFMFGENRRKAEALKVQLAGEKDPHLIATPQKQCAEQLLKGGETEEAIKQYDKLEQLRKQYHLPGSEVDPIDIEMGLRSAICA